MTPPTTVQGQAEDMGTTAKSRSAKADMVDWTMTTFVDHKRQWITRGRAGALHSDACMTTVPKNAPGTCYLTILT